MIDKKDLKHGQKVLIQGKPAKIYLDDDYQFWVKPFEGKCSMLAKWKTEDIQVVEEKKEKFY